MTNAFSTDAISHTTAHCFCGVVRFTFFIAELGEAITLTLFAISSLRAITNSTLEGASAIAFEGIFFAHAWCGFTWAFTNELYINFDLTESRNVDVETKKTKNNKFKVVVNTSENDDLFSGRFFYFWFKVKFNPYSTISESFIPYKEEEGDIF